MVFGAAWPVAAAVWGVLRLVEFGPRDQWGDYPDAVPVAFAIGSLAFAAGRFGLGRWLAAEEPITTTATAPSPAG